jgi:hypothetical protein
VGIAGEGFAGDQATVFRGTTDESVALLHKLESLGFRHLIIRMDPFTHGAVESFAPAIELFHSGH